MTDLANVWVCGEGLELVRADRIVSVYAHDGTSSYRRGARRGAAGHARPLSLHILLAAGPWDEREPTVALGECPGNQMVPWMVSLADALNVFHPAISRACRTWMALAI